MAKIKRFPNPGSNIEMIIHIFKSIYNNLCDKQYFSLYDIELAMINNREVSSNGYVGMKAFSLSLREDSSRDPIYNQAKMYSEVYRALGWMSSSENANLIFSMTEFGRYIATSNVDNKVLYKESVIGMADPNDILDKKDGLQMRPFKHILNATKMLDDKICKLEMIIGPMHYSDTDCSEIMAMKDEIINTRGSLKKLKEKVAEISKDENIAKNTMENYTRLPIATLEYLGWIDKEKSNKIYPGQNIVVLNFTELGKNDLRFYNSLRDIRIDEYKDLSDDEKKALIKISFYQQLKRCCIVDEYAFGDFEEDYKILESKYGKDVEFLFSPYQMLPMKLVDEVLGIKHDYKNDTEPITKKFLLEIVNQESENTQWLKEIYTKNSSNEISESFKDYKIYKEIIELSDKEPKEIIGILMNRYRNSNKDIYYPLIGDIFNILGYDCKVSRNGTNYERYDAIIVGETSIPIEIKSPGEELNISVKAIRQALENKIVLLSRKNYHTNLKTTSLAVGYNLPNDRAEVFSLIDDIKNTFDINIGVLDFRTLLEMVIYKILFKKDFYKEDIEDMKGTISVKYE